jgi:predicted outer membrane protein
VEIINWLRRLSVAAWAVITVTAGVAAMPAAAQTGDEAPPADVSSPPPSGTSPSPPSPTEGLSHFVATVIPTANFVATASRLALANSNNAKIKKYAEALAREQTAVAQSLNAWVNVKGPVVTPRSPISGKIEPGAKVRAPNLLPAQVGNLQRLSASRGKTFDALFITTQMDALSQLETLYRDFIQNGTDPGLQAIATRELPKVEQSLLALGGL